MIDTKPTESSATHTGETNQPRWLLCTLLAAAAATVVVVAVAFVTGGEADVEPDMVDELAVDPAAVIENYRIAYNSGDIDRVMALSSDESVVTDHPIVSRAAGLTAIRNVQLRDIDQAASVDAYTMFNVEVSGDTVTWDHVFTNDEGERWCAETNSAVIADGKILNWAFALDRHRCSTRG